MGLRQYLTAEEGRGYWDLLEVRKGIHLSITDGAYDVPIDIHLSAEPLCKIMVVLSGAITEYRSGHVYRSGEVSVQSCPGDEDTSYRVNHEDGPLHMVVLHCQPRAFGRPRS